MYFGDYTNYKSWVPRGSSGLLTRMLYKTLVVGRTNLPELCFHQNSIQNMSTGICVSTVLSCDTVFPKPLRASLVYLQRNELKQRYTNIRM